MKLSLKRITAFWLSVIFILLLSSCKDINVSDNLNSEPDISVEQDDNIDYKDTNVSQVQSSQSNINDEQSQVIINSENSSDAESTNSKFETSVETPNENKVPENIDTIEQNDEPVEAEKPVAKEVKAEGIDVSKWQGKIDWVKVKNSGIDFAIIRIGYRDENGVINKDENADYNIQQAQKADVLVGVYFFSTAVNSAEAKEEANFVISAIKGYSISYPVMYDCEGFDSVNNRMYNLTNIQRTDNALSFMTVVKKAGYDTMFYGSKNDLENHWETSRISSACKIMIAHYTEPTYPKKTMPDYSGEFDMWQYTDMGSVSGINGNVDMLVSYFKNKKRKPKDSSVTPSTATAPKDEEELIYTDVNETVTAKEKVNLRSGAGIDFSIVGTLDNGSTLTRTGVGSNGWSRLIYNDKTVYAISSYLTTDLSYKAPTASLEDIVAGNTFTSTDDNVTAKDSVNLRSLPTTDSDVIATLKNGDFLPRTAMSDKGWSRLIFNGKIVYAITSYLTTDTTPKPEIKPENNNGMVFDAVDEQVTAKSETNLRNAPTTVDSEVVYTLKNGEYIRCIGVSNSGWSKLEYKGQTVYAISSYLTK